MMITCISYIKVLNERALLQKYRGEISELKTKLQAANAVLVQEKENTQSVLTAERQQVRKPISLSKIG